MGTIAGLYIWEKKKFRASGGIRTPNPLAYTLTAVPTALFRPPPRILIKC